MKLHLNLTLRRAVLAAMAMVAVGTAQAETTTYNGKGDAYITGDGTIDSNEWNAIWNKHKSGTLTIGTSEGDAEVNLEKTTYNKGQVIFIGGKGNNSDASTGNDGTLNVGNGTLNVSDAIHVGNSTSQVTGKLTIDGGKVVAGSELTVGAYKGTGVVGVNNGNLTVNTDANGGVLRVGYHNGGGHNTHLEDGILLSNSTLTVGKAGGAIDKTSIGHDNSVANLILENNSTATLHDQTIVGEAGASGLIEVKGNSSLTMTGTTTLGWKGGATGKIVVESGSIATSGMLVAGNSGTGILDVAGNLNAGSITLANKAGSIGTLTSTGNITTGVLSIGQAGTGSAEIKGGALTASDIILGNDATGNGTLAIASDATVAELNSLTIGNKGKGELVTESNIEATSTAIGTAASSATVAGGATLTTGYLGINGTMNLGDKEDEATGKVTVNGDLQLGSTGTINTTDVANTTKDSILTTNGNALIYGSVNNAGVWMANGSTLNYGTITNDGSLGVTSSMTSWGTITGSGSLAVAQEGDTLTLLGSTTQGSVSNNGDIIIKGAGSLTADKLTGNGATTIVVDGSSVSGTTITADSVSDQGIQVTVDVTNATSLIGKKIDFFECSEELQAISAITLTGDTTVTEGAYIDWANNRIVLDESTRENVTTDTAGNVTTTVTTITEKIDLAQTSGITGTSATGLHFLRHETTENTSISVDWAANMSVTIDVQTETVATDQQTITEDQVAKVEAPTIEITPDLSEAEKAEIEIKNAEIEAQNAANAAAAETIAQASTLQKVELNSGYETDTTTGITEEKKTQVIIAKDVETAGSGSLQVQSVVVNQTTSIKDENGTVTYEKKDTIAVSGVGLVFEGETTYQGKTDDSGNKIGGELGFSKETQTGTVQIKDTETQEMVKTELKKVDIVQVKDNANVEISNLDMHATHSLTVGSTDSTTKATLVLNNVDMHVGGETDVNVLHLVEVNKYNTDGELIGTELKPVESEAHLTTKSVIANAEVILMGSSTLKFEEIDFGSTDETLAESGMNREQIEKLHGDTSIQNSTVVLTGGDARLGESNYTDEKGNQHKYQQIHLENSVIKGSGQVKNVKLDKKSKLTVGSSPGVVKASDLINDGTTEFYFITSSEEWKNLNNGAGITATTQSGAISQLYVDANVALNGAVTFIYQEWDATQDKFVTCADTTAARKLIGSYITEDTVITFVTGNISQLTLGENFDILEETLPILQDGMEWNFEEMFKSGTVTVIGEVLEEPVRVANAMVSAGYTVLNFGRLAESQAALRKAGTTRVWGSALGSFDSVDSDGARTGYDYNSWGGAVGVDHAFTSRTVLGVAFGCSWGENEAEKDNGYYSAGSIDQDATMIGLYGTHKFRTKGLMNDMKLSAFAAYGQFENSSSRKGIKSGHNATAEWDSDAWVLSASLSRDITTDSGLVVTPYVGVEYTKAGMDDFTEKGKSYNATYTAEEDYSNLAVKVGVSVSKTIGSFTPYAGIAYINDVARDTPKVTASGKRTITGEASMPGRSAVQLNLGTGVKLSDSWDAYAGYTAELRSKTTEHNVNVGVGYTF